MYSTGKTGRLSSRLCCAEVEGPRHRHAAKPGWGGKQEEGVGGWVWVAGWGGNSQINRASKPL